MTTLIIAWYLTFIPVGQDWPILVGPFVSREECWVAKALMAMGHDEAFCSYMAVAEQ